VFLDPPYRSGLTAPALARLGGGALLAPDAIAVVEHDRRVNLDDRVGCLARVDQRRYGDTCVSFYRSSPATAARP
jgi:16S rRNA G966 N2-methylase RsmD